MAGHPLCPSHFTTSLLFTPLAATTICRPKGASCCQLPLCCLLGNEFPFVCLFIYWDCVLLTSLKLTFLLNWDYGNIPWWMFHWFWPERRCLVSPNLSSVFVWYSKVFCLFGFSFLRWGFSVWPWLSCHLLFRPSWSVCRAPPAWVSKCCH